MSTFHEVHVKDDPERVAGDDVEEVVGVCDVPEGPGVDVDVGRGTDKDNSEEVPIDVHREAEHDHEALRAEKRVTTDIGTSRKRKTTMQGLLETVATKKLVRQSHMEDAFDPKWQHDLDVYFLWWFYVNSIQFHAARWPEYNTFRQHLATCPPQVHPSLPNHRRIFGDGVVQQHTAIAKMLVGLRRDVVATGVHHRALLSLRGRGGRITRGSWRRSLRLSDIYLKQQAELDRQLSQDLRTTLREFHNWEDDCTYGGRDGDKDAEACMWEKETSTVGQWYNIRGRPVDSGNDNGDKGYEGSSESDDNQDFGGVTEDEALGGEDDGRGCGIAAQVQGQRHSERLREARERGTEGASRGGGGGRSGRQDPRSPSRGSSVADHDHSAYARAETTATGSIADFLSLSMGPPPTPHDDGCAPVAAEETPINGGVSSSLLMEAAQGMESTPGGSMPRMGDDVGCTPIEEIYVEMDVDRRDREERERAHALAQCCPVTSPRAVLPNHCKIASMRAVETHRAELAEELEEVRQPFQVTGATLLSDGRKSRDGRPIVNFPAAGFRGVVVYMTINREGEADDAVHVLRRWVTIFHEFSFGGPQWINAICTDSASAYVGAARALTSSSIPPALRRITWLPCSVHVCNKLLSDMGMSCNAFVDVITHARVLVVFFKTHQDALHFFRTRNPDKGLIISCEMRFASVYSMLERLLALQDTLQDMMRGDDARAFASIPWSADVCVMARWVRRQIRWDPWWQRVATIVHIMQPVMELLRRMDRGGQYMSLMIEWTQDLVRRVTDACTPLGKSFVERIIRCVQDRTHHMLEPAHYAGFLLNPHRRHVRYFSGQVERYDAWLVGQAKRYILTQTGFELEGAECILACRQFEDFHIQQGRFGDWGGTEGFARGRACNGDNKTIKCASWWSQFGSGAPKLQRCALWVMHMWSCASPTERNWAVHEGIHTKKRNQLAFEKVVQLVEITTNVRLTEYRRAGCEAQATTPTPTRQDSSMPPPPAPSPAPPSPVSPLQPDREELGSSLPQRGLLHRGGVVRQLRLRSPSPGILEEEGAPSAALVESSVAPAVVSDATIAAAVEEIAAAAAASVLEEMAASMLEEDPPAAGGGAAVEGQVAAAGGAGGGAAAVEVAV
ncbi:hypothetical protein CBR_g45708 [Chara braunii]|uniref:DUF659 domain-containing protein n=1 Tax=Chara braunii TaxID=69332 RepID=A0A388K3Y0_CHABU|nr:hypothetical protein CBR_g45708 [Chara braunii]|eukprot:GBG64653.1 hypothetical protein CBR_g45708 [Chara braunii]